MPRLTREEISDLKAKCCTWQTPRAISQFVESIVDRIGSEVLFNQSGLEFLRDGWIAAEFGLARKARRVRLASDRWPDFELMLGKRTVQFEAVEADEPGRRRGLEYQNGIGEVEYDSVEDWIAKAEQAPVWLNRACVKKATKHYSSRANLVIYLNLDEYGIRQSQVEQSFPSSTSVAKDAFNAVWVLWKKRSYLVWKNGKLRFRQVDLRVIPSSLA